MCGMFTQGVALGYVVLPLRGVPLTTFDTFSSYVLLSGVNQQLRLALVYELDDEFAEERVLPCEPLARELLRVVHVERLVDEPRAGISALQHTQTLRYLGIVGAREGAHHYGHRPRHVIAHVRTTDALARLAAEEVGVVVALHTKRRVF